MELYKEKVVRDINGFVGYVISPNGSVYKKETGEKVAVNQGLIYQRVDLIKNGSTHRKVVSSLLFENYFGQGLDYGFEKDSYVVGLDENKNIVVEVLEKSKTTNHFGVRIMGKAGGFKLTRQNYIKPHRKSSVVDGLLYSDKDINHISERSFYNYDLNINYFKSLDKEGFEKELNSFVSKNGFREIKSLKGFENTTGHYLMVLDDYKQVYIGKSLDIRKRIRQHWSNQKRIDKLVFGFLQKSPLSIDSFRALDTTRIFVETETPIFDGFMNEFRFIEDFDHKYVLNRIMGNIDSGNIVMGEIKQRVMK